VVGAGPAASMKFLTQMKWGQAIRNASGVLRSPKP
jgi:hypothetical protein